MAEIVTDKLALGQGNLRPMIEIQMPCCGTTAHIEELTDTVGCEMCGVVLELADPSPEALPVAA